MRAVARSVAAARDRGQQPASARATSQRHRQQSKAQKSVKAGGAGSRAAASRGSAGDSAGGSAGDLSTILGGSSRGAGGNMDLSAGMGEDNSGAENPGELGGRNMNDEDEMFSFGNGRTAGLSGPPSSMGNNLPDQRKRLDKRR